MEVKKKIMIVDDESDILEVLEVTLSGMGYDVIAKKSSVRALDALPRIHPDLLLLDVMMPEMDGFTLYREIKKHEELKHLPVIFLSAKSDTQSIVQGLDLGSFDYITKPFNNQELGSRIRSALKIKDLEDHIRYRNRRLVSLIDGLSAISRMMPNHGRVGYHDHLQRAVFNYGHQLLFCDDFLVGFSLDDHPTLRSTVKLDEKLSEDIYKNKKFEASVWKQKDSGVIFDFLDAEKSSLVDYTFSAMAVPIIVNDTNKGVMIWYRKPAANSKGFNKDDKLIAHALALHVASALSYI